MILIVLQHLIYKEIETYYSQVLQLNRCPNKNIVN